MRTLALAEAASAAGARVELELLEGSLTESEAGRAAVIGVAVLSGHAPVPTATPVIVDVPVPSRVARRFARDRLVVFDDRNGFDGHAAIVVQPSLPSWTGPGIAGAVLAGYAYVPIGAGYRVLRDAPRSEPTPGSTDRRCRVLVCFGGSDPNRVTERMAAMVATDPRWEAEIIVGSDYAGSVADWPLGPVRDPSDLVTRMARADLLVIGAGTIKFEAACLGRPAILLAVADDQLAVGPPFAATGAACFLGDGRTIDPGDVRGAVAELVADPERCSTMSRVGFALIDGRGAERVVDAARRVAWRPLQ